MIKYFIMVEILSTGKKKSLKTQTFCLKYTGIIIM